MKKQYTLSQENKSLLIVTALAILSYFLWDSIFIYPLKIFVVILHELSHGLSAMLFGGKITNISINAMQGGYCSYMMPRSFIGEVFTASAGYLGSIFWGCLILYMGIKYKTSRLILKIIAAVVLIMTVLFVREPFGILFSLLFSITIAFSAFKMPETFNDLLVKFMGIVTCLYALLDIKDDLIARTVAGSDSHAIAEKFHMPFLSIPIGILWIIISISALLFTLIYAFKKPASSDINTSAIKKKHTKTAKK